MDPGLAVLLGFLVGLIAGAVAMRLHYRREIVPAREINLGLNEELENLKSEIAARGIRLDELPEFFHEREQYERSWTGEDTRAERPGGTKLRWDEVRRPDA